ncbi:MAG TPA: dTDP-4-amino-4,6-dideoxygalactose transaminase [Clostridia bacterium]|nr:dTDP-4-amino-4,6-dideoxygalactose transaminase [Clostridia bacterium]
MIPFNLPPYAGGELDYIEKAVKVNRKISGDGPFTRSCSDIISKQLGVRNTYLTTSGTHALEMSALLLGLKPGDEVIMPSYTFVSTANAFLLRGAIPVFVDIRPDTMNINEKLIEDAITPKTKAIVVVHYAGVSCEMDEICEIARKNNLVVIEDAAQAFLSTYKGRCLGTIGSLGAFSFHETKNISMGEGGAIVFNSDAYKLKAEIIREKGTDRSRFFRGEVDKYTWMDIGSSYLPSEINAAYLNAELDKVDDILSDRMNSWNYYYEALKPLEERGILELPYIPKECTHNAHLFYIKCKDLPTRTALMSHLKKIGIESVFHYIPLHSSPAGKKYARFHGKDEFTTKESERLLRLPLYYRLGRNQSERVTEEILKFFCS